MNNKPLSELQFQRSIINEDWNYYVVVHLHKILIRKEKKCINEGKISVHYNSYHEQTFLLECFFSENCIAYSLNLCIQILFQSITCIQWLKLIHLWWYYFISMISMNPIKFKSEIISSTNWYLFKILKIEKDGLIHLSYLSFWN